MSNSHAPLLIQAVRDHDLEKAEQLLQQGVDLELKTQSGDTVLFIATEKGFNPLIQRLIELGANLNAQEQYGLSAPILAVIYGHLDSLKLLLKQGAQACIKDRWGHCALHYAAHAENASLFFELLEYSHEPTCLSTALRLTLESHHFQKTQALLELGVDIQTLETHPTPLAYGKGGREPLKLIRFLQTTAISGSYIQHLIHRRLFSALNDSDMSILKALLDMGVKLNQEWTLSHENTPFLFAVSVSSPEIIGLCLCHGAQVNKVNRQGQSPLILAASRSKGLKILTLLLAAGADLTHQDSSGNNALMAALQNRNIHQIAFLLRAGILLNTKNKAGKTALILSAEQGQLEIMQFLLAQGAQYQPGEAPFWPVDFALAVIAQDLLLIQSLLEHPHAALHPEISQAILFWAIDTQNEEVFITLYNLGHPSTPVKELQYGPEPDMVMSRTLIFAAFYAQMYQACSLLICSGVAIDPRINAEELFHSPEMSYEAKKMLFSKVASLRHPSDKTLKPAFDPGFVLQTLAQRDIQILRSLFERGLDPNSGYHGYEHSFESYFHDALQWGYPEIIALFIEFGASVVCPIEPNGDTPLEMLYQGLNLKVLPLAREARENEGFTKSIDEPRQY